MHRGAVLGILVGAANESFPTALKSELADFSELAEEIPAFAQIAASGLPW